MQDTFGDNKITKTHYVMNVPNRNALQNVMLPNSVERRQSRSQEINKKRVNECSFKGKKHGFMSSAEHEERFLAEPSRGGNADLIQLDGHGTSTARRWSGSQTSEGPAERRQDGGGL